MKNQNGQAEAGADNSAKVDLAAAQKTAAAAEKARVQAILTSEEAKGREDLAQALAFDEKFEALTTEAALAVLATAPKAEEKEEKVEKKEEGQPALAAAMSDPANAPVVQPSVEVNEKSQGGDLMARLKSMNALTASGERTHELG